MTPSSPMVEIRQVGTGEFNWRLVNPMGEELAIGSQNYGSQTSALQAWYAVRDAMQNAYGTARHIPVDVITHSGQRISVGPDESDLREGLATE